MLVGEALTMIMPILIVYNSWIYLVIHTRE
ncbi:MAG: hypothetical protein F083_2936 [bacterium F083]|jgi:hypothetical protein|nr:MAG: hypothetical protein F083_2936 [bacterium F083]